MEERTRISYIPCEILFERPVWDELVARAAYDGVSSTVELHAILKVWFEMYDFNTQPKENPCMEKKDHCSLCGQPFSAHEPVMTLPDGGEACWMCQQPQAYQHMAQLSAAPVLTWAQARFGTRAVSFRISHIVKSGEEQYVRMSHLRVGSESRYIAQNQGGTIEEISQERFRAETEF